MGDELTAPATLTEWLHSLPISWLTQRTNGYADSTAQGILYDGQVATLREAVKARMPGLAPADALPAVGNDRGLIRAPYETESEDNFRERCRLAWDQWALAGTWAELLYQLYFTCNLGPGNVYIVQQNGLAYTLASAPDVDTDPTTILTITELGLNYNVGDMTGVPWWTFDDRNDLCARFAIIINTPPSNYLISTRAFFDGTQDSVVCPFWPMDGTTYNTLLSAVSQDGSSPVVSIDSTLSTASTVTVVTSARFTGYVDVLVWLDGSDPFCSPSLSTQNLLRTIVNRWKPAKATFMGTTVVVNGVLWGWPIGTKWGDAGLKWGDSLGARFAP